MFECSRRGSDGNDLYVVLELQPLPRDPGAFGHRRRWTGQGTRPANAVASHVPLLRPSRGRPSQLDLRAFLLC